MKQLTLIVQKPCGSSRSGAAPLDWRRLTGVESLCVGSFSAHVLGVAAEVRLTVPESTNASWISLTYQGRLILVLC